MKISRIESIVVDLPLRRPHRLSMITLQTHSLVLVRLETDTGVTGLGEIAIVPRYGSESTGTVKAIIDEVLAPALIGLDPRGIVLVLAMMDRLIKGNANAKAGVEMACIDAAARALGRPAADLLGGAALTRLPVLWVLGHGEVTADLDEAERHLAEGQHRLFLVKVGGHDKDGDVRRALAIKKALGDRASVRVDANQGWDEATATWAIERLEHGGIDVIEQPVAAGNRRAMQRLAQRFTVPIMADEAVASLEDALALAREDAADAFSIKPTKHGGLLRARQVASIAEAADITLFGGTMAEGRLGTAACAQLFACLPALAWGCQLFGPQLLADDICEGDLRYDGHELVVPNGPGFGMTVDEDKLKYYRRR